MALSRRLSNTLTWRHRGATETAGLIGDSRVSAAMGLLLILPGALVLLLLLVWPLVRLVTMSLSEPPFSIYSVTISSRADLHAFIRTGAMALFVTTGGLILGSFLAWQLRTARSRLTYILILFAVVFPLWTSVVVRNYAFAVVMQRHGILNTTLQYLGIIDEPLRFLYNQEAVFIGMLYVMLPYIVLPLYASFVNIDVQLMRAAQSLGASRFTAFRTTIIPLAAPSMIATSAIVFVISIGFYVTPLLLGGGEDPFVTNRIAHHMFVRLNLERAAATSSLLVLAAFIILFAIWRAVGKERLQRAIAGRGTK